jgi:hypothetical protein
VKRQTISTLLFAVLAAMARAQTGAGKEYETRDPFTCKSKKDPASGALAGGQLKAYVQCSNERAAGGYISLLQNVQVEIGRSRPYSAWSDSGNTSIDNSQPVYPIRGSYDLYSCRPPGSIGFPAGKNCNVRKNSEFTGVCSKTTFNDWSCPVKGTGDGLIGITYNVRGPQ